MPGQKRFKAMDMVRGVQVGNLFYATFFDAVETEKIRQDLPILHDINPGWIFEIRKAG